MQSDEKKQEREETGRRIRDAREYLSLSQEEVAEAVGISRSAVSQIERGERGVEGAELKKLAGILMVSTDQLVGIQNPKQIRVEHLARAVAGLTQRDLDELTRFAQFLASKPKQDL